MRLILICLIVCGLVWVNQSDREEVVVSRVIDGDTLVLEDGRKVRLLQINAPEKGQCGYDDATRALRDAVSAVDRVSLEHDARLGEIDDYGRLLRYVYADGVNVNVKLQQQGFVDKMFYDGKQGKYAWQMDGPGSCA